MQASAEDCAELDLALPAEATSIKKARDALSELAERSGAPARDVKLAVSEAVSNAVIHGYRDGKEGTIRVRGRVERDRLVIEVVDQGGGMRPNLDSPGLGVGISVITSLASDVRFDSSDVGVTVAMTFDVQEAQ